MEREREALISCDTITNITRQSSLEFITESVHIIRADHYVGFYELFILRSHITRLQIKDKIYGMASEISSAGYRWKEPQFLQSTSDMKIYEYNIMSLFT
jgi:hypothetical protein